MVLMLCRLKAQVRPLPPFTEGWSILSLIFLINAFRSFPASDDPILAKFSNCYWKFNPASIMSSFLRISGSNYSYMLNISLLTKLWKQKYKDKSQFFAYPLENSVKGVYLLTLLKGTLMQIWKSPYMSVFI